ncbi:MAG: hypothetical protein ABUS51_00485, partial [Acidobacteriota bacterium]
ADTLAKLPGRGIEAQLEYEELLEKEPRSALARLRLGNLLLQAPESFDEALRHLQLAVALQPDLAEAHLALAGALSRIPGRNADAQSELRTALRLNPALARHVR